MSLGIVGSIVGPLSAVPSGSGASLPDTGHGYDVAIGGLGFKLKISDQSPYERATAQFRKEQFDNSGRYGDQSLVGYWTRGQLSFHHGAGINYYDVGTSGDEVVADRYTSGTDVDPWTPGKVALPRDFANATTSSLTEVDWAGTGSTGWLGIIDNDVFRHTTTPGSGTLTSFTPSAGTAAHAAAGPSVAYVLTTSNKIERVFPWGGASDVIYTSATALSKIFYAKDRLWVFSDTTGNWYQLSPNPAAPPVAIGAGDKVFTAPYTGVLTRWSVCETPGPVLFATGGTVYSVTIDSTGTVPSMSGPVQVAQFPIGETVQGMMHHLGFVVISTNKGVRVALAETGAGGFNFTYGPLLFEWDDNGATPAAFGSSVFVPGFEDGAGYLYEVNLAQQVGNGLEFAWSRRLAPGTLGGSDYAFALRGGVGYSGETTLKYTPTEGNLISSGQLTTAYHRFGTLEHKKFMSVIVRCAGTSGTIVVYKVLSDGSEVSLHTLDVSQTAGEEITLSMSDPAEMVGLKFVLSRSVTDATTGPTLLGYQLRALPAPKRQRMIRLPVMLMDVERRSPTRATGYDGSAWDRLEALENMEQSGGTFTYQDFRTGEAGTVFIESVEHKGVTPPGKQNNGFGGVVWLTLRKL